MLKTQAALNRQCMRVQSAPRSQADRVVVELAKIAFANVRDYWPPPGEGIHLHWADRTAVVEELTVVEAVECCIAEPASRASKVAALTNLVRHLGMFADRRVAEGS